MTRLESLTRVTITALVCFTICWGVYYGAKPLTDFVEAMNRDCVVGVPEKPGKDFKLQWIQEKRKK